MLGLIITVYAIMTYIYFDKLFIKYDDELIVTIMLALSWPYVLIKGINNI
jgi:hypothetical protein